MGRKISISRLGAGLAFLLTLAATVFLIPKGNRAEIAGGLSLTPSALPTPSIWEEISLGQISFGPPRVVLTDTLGFRIVGWISNNEVLIRRDIRPGGRGSAMEVFNVRTREVKRLAEGAFSGNPVWNPVRRAVVYLQYDEVRKQRDLIWQSLDTLEKKKLASDVILPIVLIEGGKGAAAYSVKEKALTGRSIVPGAQVRNIPFAQYEMRVPTPYEWIYQTKVSPDGKWQVVFNIEHFLLVSTQTGQIKEIDLGEEWGRKRWALDAQWSPDGEKLAIIATIGRLPNTIRFLLLLDPKTEHVQEIPVSRPFVIYHADWSPSGRFLLLSGAIDYKEGFAVVEHRLLDISTGEEHKLKLFPLDPLTGASFAWSPDGKKLIVNCTRPGLSALCTLSVEVQR